MADSRAADLFGGKDSGNFGDLQKSLFSLFQASTGDGWASAITAGVVENVTDTTITSSSDSGGDGDGGGSSSSSSSCSASTSTSNGNAILLTVLIVAVAVVL